MNDVLLVLVGAFALGMVVAFFWALSLRRQLKQLREQAREDKLALQEYRDTFHPDPVTAARRDLEEHNGQHLFFVWDDKADASNRMAIAEMAWLASRYSGAPLIRDNAQQIDPMLQMFERRPDHLVPKTQEEIRDRILHLIGEMVEYREVEVVPRVTRIDLMFRSKTNEDRYDELEQPFL